MKLRLNTKEHQKNDHIPTLIAVLLILISAIFVILSQYFIYTSQQIIVLTSVLALSLISTVFYQFKNMQSKNNNIQYLVSLLEKTLHLHEYCVFNSRGENIITTLGQQFENKAKLIQQLYPRIIQNVDKNTFKSLIEEEINGSCFIEVKNEYDSSHNKKWYINTLKTKLNTQSNDSYFILSFTNITSCVTQFEDVQKENDELIEFIDNALFGIVYAHKNNHKILGLNSTFASFLNKEKDDFLNLPFKNFIKNFDERNFHSIQLCETISNKHPSKECYVFNQRDESSSIYKIMVIDTSLFANIHGKNSNSLHTETFYLHSPIPSLVISSKYDIINVNQAFEKLISESSYSTKIDKNAKFLSLLKTDKIEDITSKLSSLFEKKGTHAAFDIFFTDLPSYTTAYAKAVNVVNDSTKEINIILQFIDTSAQKLLEQQFIQSQKMQAVGQLAGGIAHDFNNLLTAMIGFCDLLLERYMPNDPSYMDIIQIKQNANRAANLVRQLLAFSRQQNLQPKIINITDVLAELSALLRRLIGAHINMHLNHGRDIWPIWADISQLEQVVINMVVNARDAMEDVVSGSLSIITSNFKNMTPMNLRHDIMPVGEYVLIEVIDNGHGIDPINIEHIFEPFFSTKEVGAGTGLGLSTVFGIVKQTEGYITVDSTVNKGTHFKIYIPRYHGEEQKIVVAPETTSRDLTGSETILLVEDEDAVRLFSSRALRDKGYTVIEAESGDVALDIVENGGKFDLLITDVVMPKMDGPTLCNKILEIYPNLKTIFISGYAEDTFRKNLGNNSNIHFLQKPFTLKDLAEKIKEVL